MADPSRLPSIHSLINPTLDETQQRLFPHLETAGQETQKIIESFPDSQGNRADRYGINGFSYKQQGCYKCPSVSSSGASMSVSFNDSTSNGCQTRIETGHQISPHRAQACEPGNGFGKCCEQGMSISSSGTENTVLESRSFRLGTVREDIATTTSSTATSSKEGSQTTLQGQAAADVHFLHELLDVCTASARKYWRSLSPNPRVGIRLEVPTTTLDPVRFSSSTPYVTTWLFEDAIFMPQAQNEIARFEREVESVDLSDLLDLITDREWCESRKDPGYVGDHSLRQMAIRKMELMYRRAEGLRRCYEKAIGARGLGPADMDDAVEGAEDLCLMLLDEEGRDEIRYLAACSLRGTTKSWGKLVR